MHIYSTSLMYWELIMSLRFIFSLKEKQYKYICLNECVRVILDYIDSSLLTCP